jgi:hypothetical protein
MNQVTLSVDGGVEEVEAFVTLTRGLVGVWSRLGNWKVEEAVRLAEAGGLGVGEIPLVDWQGRFPSSVGASVDAFCRFVGFDLPSHPDMRSLTQRRTAFLAA